MHCKSISESLGASWSACVDIYSVKVVFGLFLLLGSLLVRFLHVNRLTVPGHRTLHCVSKKVPTFKLSVPLSNLNRFSKKFALLESVWNLLQHRYDITHLSLEFKGGNFFETQCRVHIAVREMTFPTSRKIAGLDIGAVRPRDVVISGERCWRHQWWITLIVYHAWT